MATGDQTDFVARIKRVLPTGWFGEPGSTPYLDGLLAGCASALAWLYAWITFAALQTRLATASGEFLDYLCSDFLGNAIARQTAETDAAFRIRIRKQILEPRVTRSALLAEVLQITGIPGVIFEYANPTDTGGWLDPAAPTTFQGLAYGQAGGWGSRSLPFQVQVTAYRPSPVPVPYVGGWGSSVGGYGIGSLQWNANPNSAANDAAILASIKSVMPVATRAWVNLTNVPPIAGAQIDVDFTMDVSRLG
jgi:hypothetical protein